MPYPEGDARFLRPAHRGARGDPISPRGPSTMDDPARPGGPPPPPEPGPARSIGPGAPFRGVVGVLGGVASGKSTVARGLAGDTGLVLSADEIAHHVLASPEVTALVRERFGDEVLDSEGRPDRARLAALAFDGPGAEEARQALEGWIHPRVRATILARVREARAGGVGPVVLDVPLLLENDAQHGFVALCDALVLVDAPQALREERARSKRGWRPGDVARRELAQLPLDEKRRRAGFVLLNQGTSEDLEREVERVLAELARLS